jgi:hypothetical protein
MPPREAIEPVHRGASTLMQGVMERDDVAKGLIEAVTAGRPQ